MAELAELLTGGDRRSIGASDEVVSRVVADPSLFSELVEALSNEDDLVRIRAADALEKVSRRLPQMLPAYRDLVAKLAVSPEMEVRWHIAQMMPRLGLEGKDRAGAIELLFTNLDDDSALVRVTSLSSLAEMARSDDELRERLVEVVEELVKTGSPSVRARSRKLLKSLKPDDE